MPYVSNFDEFTALYLKAQKLPALTSLDTSNLGDTTFFFEPVNLLRRGFFDFVRRVMEISGDTSCFYVYSDPDAHNFIERYSRYPAVEFSIENSHAEYASMMWCNGEAWASAMVDFAIVCSIFPLSLNWYIYSDRTYDLAYFYAPHPLIEKVKSVYNFDTTPIEEVLEIIKR